jgi:tetratricopeptide (TPR) repeat protein
MTSPTPGTPARKPRRRWRWHVPPALVHGDETLEGTEIFEDVTGPAGMVLWQTMRDVTLWAGVREVEERAGLFQPGAHERRIAELAASGVDAAIEAPLRVLAQVSRDPAGRTEEELLTACREISQWAEGRQLPAVAIAFAQAGALAAPAHAAAGFRVGQIARDRAEYARAETWFRRTIGLGRQAKDWASYSEAFLGLGNLYIQRGNYPAARRFHIRGLRAARRHGLRDIVARALHDLFVIAVDTGAAAAEAQEFARGAFRAYGNHHPRLPRLAHDLAYFWMQRGRFPQSMAVFQAILPHMVNNGERLMTLADIGRAAGGAGNREVFDEAWSEVWSASGEWDKRPNGAQAALELARGAASLKDWARAERAASTAREVAERRGEARVLLEAETVLDSVTRRRALESAEPAGGEEGADAEDLFTDLLRSLTSEPAGGK